MRRPDLRLAAALCASTSLFACVNDDEFRKAVPTASQVTIQVPGTRAAGQRVGDVGVVSQGLVGDPSELYALTWAVSTTVNLSTLALLGVLHAIVEQHPTSQTRDSRTFGPYTPGGLDPLTYRATVIRIDVVNYSFAIEARPRASQAEADYLALLDGTITRGASDGQGKGEMTLRFDNGRALRPTQCEQGAVHFAFDNTTPPAKLDVQFSKFANANPRGIGCQSDTPTDATYHYSRAAGGAGDFVFALQTNIHKVSENKPALEDVSIRSRWLGAGPGRADVKIAGGEVATDLAAARLGQDFVLGSQCWDATFATAYETSTPEALHVMATAGDPSACAFSSQQLP